MEQVIRSFDDAFESALLHTPMRMTSGLVEQQAWFAKARKWTPYFVWLKIFRKCFWGGNGSSVLSGANRVWPLIRKARILCPDCKICGI